MPLPEDFDKRVLMRLMRTEPVDLSSQNEMRRIEVQVSLGKDKGTYPYIAEVDQEIWVTDAEAKALKAFRLPWGLGWEEISATQEKQRRSMLTRRQREIDTGVFEPEPVADAEVADEVVIPDAVTADTIDVGVPEAPLVPDVPTPAPDVTEPKSGRGGK